MRRSNHLEKRAVSSLLLVLFAVSGASAAERRGALTPRSSGASSTVAAEPDAQTKMAARQMAREALELMHEERWSEAQSLLARAYRLVPAPTVALLEGRALEKMSKLVDAAGRYDVAASTPVTGSSPEAFRQAVREARDELSELKERIPKLAIMIQGERPEGQRLQVSVDGETLELGALESPRDVNPGEHVVKATIDGEVMVEDHVLVKEGESKQVLLRLVSRAKPQREVVAPAADTTVSDGGSSMVTWGWITLGVGIAGVATGVVAGKLMVDAKEKLDDRCNPTCPPSLQDDLSRFRTTRTVSAVGYGIGAVGIAVGAAMLLFAPSNPEPARPTTSVWSDGRTLGVRGEF